jgi:hypothetical protein
MARRSAVVSINNLGKSIDKAVALAAERHGVKLSDENVIVNWEIVGRILRDFDKRDANGPLDVANTIAKSAGLNGTPVVTKVGRDILVGVIPRDFNVRF